MSWDRSSSNIFRAFKQPSGTGRWYQHYSHAQCTHIIHGLTLRITVQAEIQLWDKRRYLSSRKRSWGDNNPDKTEEKARHRHREGNKNKKRDNETCKKILNHGGRQGLVKAHCSSSALYDCASEHAVSCMKRARRSWSSKLLSHHAKTANSNTLAILTHCHHKTTPCTKPLFIEHGFMLLRGKGSSLGLPSVVTSSVK